MRQRTYRRLNAGICLAASLRVAPVPSDSSEVSWVRLVCTCRLSAWPARARCRAERVPDRLACREQDSTGAVVGLDLSGRAHGDQHGPFGVELGASGGGVRGSGRRRGGHAQAVDGHLAAVPASLVYWQAAVRGVAIPAYCPAPTSPRGGCPCLTQTHPGHSSRRRGRSGPRTAGPKPCHARIVATAPVRTLTPVPARPAAAGGDAVSAGVTPGSIPPTPLDWPWARSGAAGGSSCSIG
jgi:hypothetical protein